MFSFQEDTTEVTSIQGYAITIKLFTVTLLKDLVGLLFMDSGWSYLL